MNGTWRGICWEATRGCLNTRDDNTRSGCSIFDCFSHCNKCGLWCIASKTASEMHVATQISWTTKCPRNDPDYAPDMPPSGPLVVPRCPKWSPDGHHMVTKWSPATDCHCQLKCFCIYTVVVITFSKTDPDRVRASTSSSRLIGNYFKTL